LIQGPGDLREEWFDSATTVGVTAGASTPDYVIDEVETANQQEAYAGSGIAT
jgi:4-hydroxy-3-methylbut-2-enyl diphosphate reductase IspH